MTQDDQDAVIGRIVRERRDLQAKLAALESEADKLGAMLINLGTMLEKMPAMLVFEGHHAPAGLSERYPLFKPTDIDAAKIMKLVDEYRDTKQQLATIETRAQQLGI